MTNSVFFFKKIVYKNKISNFSEFKMISIEVISRILYLFVMFLKILNSNSMRRIRV